MFEKVTIPELKSRNEGPILEKGISSAEMFKGVLLNVRRDEVELPDGKKALREYLNHGGAVCVVPVTDDGNVIMEWQYRYAVGRPVIEIPAGKLDSLEEDRLEAAKRELREETGLTAENWTDLGAYLPAPAYSCEYITMYLATGLKRGERHLDEGEFLEVFEIPLTELVEEIMKGTIVDGKTIAAVLKAYMAIKQEKDIEKRH